MSLRERIRSRINKIVMLLESVASKKTNNFSAMMLRKRKKYFC